MLILEPIAADEIFSRRQNKLPAIAEAHVGSVNIMERNNFMEISPKNVFLASRAARWNLRNGKIWFIHVFHEIYAHTVYVWIYVLRSRSIPTDSERPVRCVREMHWY